MARPRVCRHNVRCPVRGSNPDAQRRHILHRRTKGYTESVAMLASSLAMVLADWPAKSCASLC